MLSPRRSSCYSGGYVKVAVAIEANDAVIAATLVGVAVAMLLLSKLQTFLCPLPFSLLAGYLRGVGQPRSLDALAATAESRLQDFWGVLRLFS